MSTLLYMGSAMSFEEKNAWNILIVSTAVYAGYAYVILSQAASMPLSEVPYVWPMLWAIGISVLIMLGVVIVISILAPKEADKRDERDRVISRFGDHVGQSFVVIGANAALIMCMVELDYFWIANVIFLGFFLSAILAAIAKIAFYRFGFHSW